MGLLNTKQLQRTGEGSELRQQFPTVYGLLAGLLGTSPDEMAGSVLDPNTAAVKRGADMGYLPGLIVGSLPSGKAAGLAGIAGKGVRSALEMAPQAKALETARVNAVKMLGLPETNTAMDRARALGFYTDVFHGSKNPGAIKNLVPGGADGAIKHGDAYGTGVYTTTDAIGDASSYGSGGAVFPLLINRTNHLQVDSPGSKDIEKLSVFAGEHMMPSDKARFAIGQDKRQFDNVQDARDFFANQRENWRQFGGGYERAKPEAIKNEDGSFAVRYTNFDAPVPITNGHDANTLLNAVGWNNVPSMGYSGHTLDRGGGRFWDVTPDTTKLRSRFAAFDPARINENDLLGRADPYMLGLLGALSGGAYVASEKK